MSIVGPAWHNDLTGKSVYDYGTPSANERLRKIIRQLKTGEIKTAAIGWDTVDGHRCKAHLTAHTDHIQIISTDITQKNQLRVANGGGR